MNNIILEMLVAAKLADLRRARQPKVKPCGSPSN